MPRRSLTTDGFRVCLCFGFRSPYTKDTLLALSQQNITQRDQSEESTSFLFTCPLPCQVLVRKPSLNCHTAHDRGAWICVHRAPGVGWMGAQDLRGIGTDRLLSQLKVLLRRYIYGQILLKARIETHVWTAPSWAKRGRV